jgi:hypothetical protein
VGSSEEEMNDKYRGTGRTTRMLEAAIATSAFNVVIVAPTVANSRYILSRLKELGAEMVNPSRNEAFFSGGKVIRVISTTPKEVANGSLRGIDALVFRDHTFDELPWEPGTSEALAIQNRSWRD